MTNRRLMDQPAIRLHSYSFLSIEQLLCLFLRSLPNAPYFVTFCFFPFNPFAFRIFL